MRQAWRNEQGMALAVAIFALVVVGGLVAGAFFIGTQEQRMGENQQRVQQAFGLAEAGAAEILRGWDPDSFNLRLRPFPADTVKLGRRGFPAGTGSYGGNVFKLNQNLYFMDLFGADTATGRGSATLARRGSGGRQRIGVLTRIRPLQIPSSASLTTQGTVRLAGRSSIDGNNQNPPLWGACDPITPADTNKVGVRTSATGAVLETSPLNEVKGYPPVVKDPTLTADSFTVFGDVTYDQLAAMATYTIAAGGLVQTKPVTTASGACNKAVPTNWGDGLNRAGPCGNHFPIVHIKGPQLTTINNFQGQGILLVDGDLRIQGFYDFFGVAIVRGSLSTLGTATTAAHFWGAVMAQNVDLDVQTFGGAANMVYSKCAIVTALQHTGISAYLRSRGFVNLY